MAFSNQRKAENVTGTKRTVEKEVIAMAIERGGKIFIAAEKSYQEYSW